MLEHIKVHMLHCNTKQTGAHLSFQKMETNDMVREEGGNSFITHQA